MDTKTIDIILKTIEVGSKNNGEFLKMSNRFKKMLEEFTCDEDTYCIIARVIFGLWPYNFFKWAENIIFKKAILEGYFNKDQIEHILCFDDKEGGDYFDDRDVFSSETDPNVYVTSDDIIFLIWDVFAMKEHYNLTKSHRIWIKRSYDRLSKYMVNDVKNEEDDEELKRKIYILVEKHDLSKYAFSQAIGYTLKWVHKIRDQIGRKIWDNACALHLANEPHHVQYYMTERNIFKVHEHYHAKTERDEMEICHIYESFIDMVACEWERKKGRNLDISDSELVYMNDYYLNRYTEKERFILNKLIAKCNN